MFWPYAPVVQSPSRYLWTSLSLLPLPLSSWSKFTPFKPAFSSSPLFSILVTETYWSHRIYPIAWPLHQKGRLLPHQVILRTQLMFLTFECSLYRIVILYRENPIAIVRVKSSWGLSLVSRQLQGTVDLRWRCLTDFEMSSRLSLILMSCISS